MNELISARIFVWDEQKKGSSCEEVAHIYYLQCQLQMYTNKSKTVFSPLYFA